MTLTQTISGPDGSFGAYIAHPNTPNGAALVVIQEIFGVNAAMRELADHYATLGYVAIVPDLFWRIEVGVNISDKTPEDMSKAFDLFGKFKTDTGIIDIQATIDFARTLCPKVGAVGYCLGGLMAFFTAAMTDVDASVSFYGVSIELNSEKATEISRPFLMHVASEDKFVSKDAQKVISHMAAKNTLIELHIYNGLDHAFARPGGEHFDATGAILANQRTASFFEVSLLS
jgi:carboxymethylenebutenolidase